VLNKFGPSGHGEAQVQYLMAISRDLAGTYVRCAVTDARDTARRVEHTGASICRRPTRIPSAVLQRHFPGALKPENIG